MLMDDTRQQPVVTPYGKAPQATTATSGQSNPLNSMYQNLLGQIGAGAAQQQAGIDLGASTAYGQQQTTDQQLQQQYQDALASLGIQQTGIGEQSAYNTQQYGFEQQQQGLSRTGIEQGLANLAAQYGIQQQGFGIQGQQLGLQGTEAQQQYGQGMQDIGTGTAAGGTGTTAQRGLQGGRLTQGYQDTLKQLGLQKQQLGLEEKGAAQSYKYGQQQGQQQLAQLGLTGQEQAAGYAYGQQQIQNQLAQLGLSRTEAGQTLTTGQQNAANQYLSQMAGLMGQQGQIGPGEAQSIASLYQQLFGAA